MATEITNRSQEDILAQAPIRLRFGAKDYDVKVLRILESRKWRQSLLESVKEIAGTLQQKTGSDNAFLSGLGFTLLQFPEKMAELVLSYASALDKDEILNEATEEQMARAFSQIMAVAFPFQESLRTITQVLGMAAANSQR